MWEEGWSAVTLCGQWIDFTVGVKAFSISANFYLIFIVLNGSGSLLMIKDFQITVYGDDEYM